MSRSLEQDRLTQILIGGDFVSGLDEAEARLNQAAIRISVGPAEKTAWGQAALLTIAECAVRMFRGGVYLHSEFNEPAMVGCRTPVPLRRVLLEAGCRSTEAPSHALALHVGAEDCGKVFLQCWADGWVATISPRPGPVDAHIDGNEISGALAGALAVTEAFRKSVLNDLRAGKKTQRLSPLTPNDPQPLGIGLNLLPSRCWLLGLGNLGQAVLWVMGLLPYADPAKVELLLQDTDTSGLENIDTQVLTKYHWIGRKKARMAAAWAEERGFRTVINERSFVVNTQRTKEEPGLAFICVDNVEARRAAARVDAGFDLLIDAGLGATASEIFDIRIHSFPGFRTPNEAWPEVPTIGAAQISRALARIVDSGSLDRCGALNIAGRSVGMPSTAIAAATIQVAQACRAIISNVYCDLADVGLVDPKRSVAHESSLRRGGIIPSAHARAK